MEALSFETDTNKYRGKIDEMDYPSDMEEIVWMDTLAGICVCKRLTDWN